MSTDGFERAPELEALGVDHGFGTRAVRAPPEFARVRQVHGTAAALVPPDLPLRPADAVYTLEPGRAVGVVTADCVPLLLIDRQLRAAAAIHAGWRGSAGEIALRTVRLLEAEHGIDPSSLLVAIGPHIGPCCYEVDEPVMAQIEDPHAFTPTRPSHGQLDLYALNHRQLLRAGVPAAAISRVGGCTSCHPNRYASYRRDGTGGRLEHYIRLPLDDGGRARTRAVG